MTDFWNWAVEKRLASSQPRLPRYSTTSECGPLPFGEDTFNKRKKKNHQTTAAQFVLFQQALHGQEGQDQKGNTRPSNRKGDRWPVAKRTKHYHKDMGVSGFFRCR